MKLKLVICRSDLPENPRAAEQGYPFASCWDVLELMEEGAKAGPGSELYEHARRVYWECVWRFYDRYKRGRPFFRVYEMEDGVAREVPPEQWRFVCSDVVVSAMESGIVPEWAKEQAERLYKRLFGPLAK